MANDAAHVPVILVYPLPDSSTKDDAKEEAKKGVKGMESNVNQHVVSSKEDQARDVAVIHAYSSDREDEGTIDEIEIDMEEEEVDYGEEGEGDGNMSTANQNAGQEITVEESFGKDLGKLPAMDWELTISQYFVVLMS